VSGGGGGLLLRGPRMSVNYETVKRIMKELAIAYPEYVTEETLSKKTGRPSMRTEILYCHQKEWIKDRPSSQQYGNAWRATAKGIDASEIMETEGKPCTHIPA